MWTLYVRCECLILKLPKFADLMEVIRVAGSSDAGLQVIVRPAKARKGYGALGNISAVDHCCPSVTENRIRQHWFCGDLVHSKFRRSKRLNNDYQWCLGRRLRVEDALRGVGCTNEMYRSLAGHLNAAYNNSFAKPHRVGGGIWEKFGGIEEVCAVVSSRPRGPLR